MAADGSAWPVGCHRILHVGARRAIDRASQLARGASAQAGSDTATGEPQMPWPEADIADSGVKASATFSRAVTPPDIAASR